MRDRETLQALHLGRIGYQEAWDLQKDLQARAIHSKRAGDHTGPLEHPVLFVEHPPVFTLGKSGDDAHLLLDQDGLRKQGFEFHRIDRGGDITYHGPGQLVVYPILDLDRFFTDIHRYLRELEEAVVLTCADFGITAGRVEGRTGVWVGPDASGPERKVCAMGIRCSRWVTMHGLAFNVATDLSHFDHIVPCGITDRGVTSLEQETGSTIELARVAYRLLKHLGTRFGADIRSEAEPWAAINEWRTARPLPEAV